MSALPNPQTLALFSDFGLRDAYSGQVKLSALSLLTPLARSWTTIVDVTHGLPAYQVGEAAFQLWQSVPTAPAHTTFLCGVDPAKLKLASETTSEQPTAPAYVLAYRSDYQQVFLGPNNGVLYPVIEQYGCSVWGLSNPAYLHPNLHSANAEAQRAFSPERQVPFAARDILAPVAAHAINAQVDDRFEAFLADLGPELSAPVESASEGSTSTGVAALPDWQAEAELQEDGSFQACILSIDGYGNATTNLPLAWWPAQAKLALAKVSAPSSNPPGALAREQEGVVPVLQRFNELPPEAEALKTPCLLAGSGGRWVLSRYQGSAAQQLGLQVGSLLHLKPFDS